MKQKFPSQVVKPVVVTIKMLAQFPAKTVVSPGVLKKANIVTTRHQHVKLIGNDKLDRSLTVRVHRATAAAKKAIEAAGGKVEIIVPSEVK